MLLLHPVAKHGSENHCHWAHKLSRLPRCHSPGFHSPWGPSSMSPALSCSSCARQPFSPSLSWLSLFFGKSFAGPRGCTHLQLRAYVTTLVISPCFREIWTLVSLPNTVRVDCYSLSVLDSLMNHFFSQLIHKLVWQSLDEGSIIQIHATEMICDYLEYEFYRVSSFTIEFWRSQEGLNYASLSSSHLRHRSHHVEDLQPLSFASIRLLHC